MTLIDAIGWKATGVRNRLADRGWERRLGIHTTGSQEVDQPDANRYATFAYGSIFRILDRLELGADDVFVDIGCGKGRVVCCAALKPLRQVIGVDIDADLCAKARENAAKLQGRRSPITIINAGAQEFDYEHCTAFFLFNSFGTATLREVLAKIDRSLRNDPRSIRFAYVNPFHESVIVESKMLAPYDRWQRRPWSGLKFDVSFWKSSGHGR